MANSYKKIYLHVVFAVKHRKALLHKSWRQSLFKYMAQSLNHRGHFSLAVNGHIDHVHLFFSYSTNELIPDLVREIKKSATKFINDNQFTNHKFEWQSGYAVFSNSDAEIDRVIKYIVNQENHHAKVNFQKEYLDYLHKYLIEYKDEYVFDFLETE